MRCINIIDPVVLESNEIIWPGGQSSLPSICHWNISGSTARLCQPGGDEWASEVSDSQRWPFNRKTPLCSHMVWSLLVMCVWFALPSNTALTSWICLLMRRTINCELNCCLPLGNVQKALDLPSSFYHSLYDIIHNNVNHNAHDLSFHQ